SPAGDRGDHLPIGVEEIGVIPGPNGPEPVRLVRRHFPEGTRWIFSRSTVERIDPWFGRMRDRWQQQYLPEALLRPGPKELLWWQWIALPILFVVSLGLGVVLGLVTRLVLAKLFARAEISWDRALFARLGAPLTLLWAVAGVWAGVPRLALY